MNPSEFPIPPRSEVSIPGKVFLLGEYAVLAGGTAVIAAVGPRFALTLESQPGTVPLSGLHGKSPVRRWLGSADIQLNGFFKDPHGGAGGFGASTAQFALAVAAVRGRVSLPSAWEVWRDYRALHRGEAVPPSGADLLAQWSGGVRAYDLQAQTSTDLFSRFDFSKLLIFGASRQAGRKVATHEHLPALARSGKLLPDGAFARQLGEICAAGIQALKKNDAEGFGREMNAYAQALSEPGLEIKATREDRAAFAAVEGVIGVKGTGALQADAVLVLVKDEVARAAAVELAARRELDAISLGVVSERGIAWECQ